MARHRPTRKNLRWLHGEIKTPPFTTEGRIEAGQLLGRLQEGESLGMPHSRPLRGVGAGVQELRVRDAGHNWRIVYRVDPTIILIVAVYAKTSATAQDKENAKARKRLAQYDRIANGGD